MLFDDRIDAASKLAQALVDYRGRNPLVLAIPRGAVPMARALADALQGELDIVLVHKLGSPWNPEYAIGAIDESGWAFVSQPHETVGDAYLQEEKAKRLESLRRRRAHYTPGRMPIDARGREVIVVDDGLATGSTMIAALHAVRQQAPARLVCAVPVAAPDSLEKVRPYADEIVCLDAPEYFRAVGQFYRDFPQVEDDEVIASLAQTRPPAERQGNPRHA